MKNLALISLPSPAGETSGVDFDELDSYFRIFPGGVQRFVETALHYMFDDDLYGFVEFVSQVYSDEISSVINDCLTADQGVDHYRQFRRKIFGLWKYLRHATEVIGDIGIYDTVGIERKVFNRLSICLQ